MGFCGWREEKEKKALGLIRPTIPIIWGKAMATYRRIFILMFAKGFESEGLLYSRTIESQEDASTLFSASFIVPTLRREKKKPKFYFLFDRTSCAIYQASQMTVIGANQITLRKAVISLSLQTIDTKKLSHFFFSLEVNQPNLIRGFFSVSSLGKITAYLSPSLMFV